MTKLNRTPFPKPATDTRPKEISEEDLAQLERLHNAARRAADTMNDFMRDLSVKYGTSERDQISWSGRIIWAPDEKPKA